MKRTEKQAEIATLTESFREADAVLLTEYRGLTVEQMKSLRRELGAEVRYHVAKNTLARIAAQEAGLEDIADDLTARPLSLSSPVTSLPQLRPSRTSQKVTTSSSLRPAWWKVRDLTPMASRYSQTSNRVKSSSRRQQEPSRLRWLRLHSSSRHPPRRLFVPLTPCVRSRKPLLKSSSTHTMLITSKEVTASQVGKGRKVYHGQAHC